MDTDWIMAILQLASLPKFYGIFCFIPGFPKIYGSCLIFVRAGHYDFSLIFGENRGSFIS
jgi:hypothetical protein